MTAIYLPEDRVFFDEWSRLHTRLKRSIPRAATFAQAIGVDLRAVPAIVVVGSKGKATAATYASAALAAAGHRVGTITSPPIITNRERIRVDGLAIDEATYADIATRAERAMRAMPEPTAGYLSPAGMYMVAGIDHLRRARCDVLVIEAGMGGRSDEVSLLDPPVLAVTPIFEEHLGILGNNVQEILEEKLGAAGPNTKVIRSPHLGASEAVGVAAARAFDEHANLVGVTIHLPGRRSWHVDAEGRQWLVDAAVDLIGVMTALQTPDPRFARPGPLHAERGEGGRRPSEGNVDFVLVSLPDGKDITRVTHYLDGHMPGRWLPVRPPMAPHLSYDTWDRPVAQWDAALANGYRRIAAIGSWSFMSAVLHWLGVDNERAFSVAAKDP